MMTFHGRVISVVRTLALIGKGKLRFINSIILLTVFYKEAVTNMVYVCTCVWVCVSWLDCIGEAQAAVAAIAREQPEDETTASVTADGHPFLHFSCDSAEARVIERRGKWGKAPPPSVARHGAIQLAWLSWHFGGWVLIAGRCSLGRRWGIFTLRWSSCYTTGSITTNYKVIGVVLISMSVPPPPCKLCATCHFSIDAGFGCVYCNGNSHLHVCTLCVCVCASTCVKMLRFAMLFCAPGSLFAKWGRSWGIRDAELPRETVRVRALPALIFSRYGAGKLESMHSFKWRWLCVWILLAALLSKRKYIGNQWNRRILHVLRCWYICWCMFDNWNQFIVYANAAVHVSIEIECWTKGAPEVTAYGWPLRTSTATGFESDWIVNGLKTHPPFPMFFSLMIQLNVSAIMTYWMGACVCVCVYIYICLRCIGSFSIISCYFLWPFDKQDVGLPGES